jgi:hypothetical protein
MPPMQLPDGRASSDHRWSATTRSKPADWQPTAPARLPRDGFGRPSIQPQPHPGRAGRPLTPCPRTAAALAADLESP